MKTNSDKTQTCECVFWIRRQEYDQQQQQEQLQHEQQKQQLEQELHKKQPTC